MRHRNQIIHYSVFRADTIDCMRFIIHSVKEGRKKREDSASAGGWGTGTQLLQVPAGRARGRAGRRPEASKASVR